MKDCVPGLLEWLTGDECNVLLTLAPIWVTLSTGLILPKSEGAD